MSLPRLVKYKYYVILLLLLLLQYVGTCVIYRRRVIPTVTTYSRPDSSFILRTPRWILAVSTQDPVQSLNILYTYNRYLPLLSYTH